MGYGFIAFVVSMLIGIPIGFSLGVGAVAALLVKGYNIGVIAVRMFTGIDSFPIMAIPFFRACRRANECHRNNKEACGIF